MRGALLVLALLVTQELGVKMAETCPIFYEVFTAVASGNELLLDFSLTKVNATEPERTAMKKIQDCYVENGLISKASDVLVMITISSSKDCMVGPVQKIAEALKPNILGR